MASIIVKHVLITLLLYVSIEYVSGDRLTDAMMYLQKYKYIGEEAVDPSMKVVEIKEGPKLTEALREFQRMAGLPQTGVIDDNTARMMKKPRCGIPDVHGLIEGSSRRSKRYALLGSKWKKNFITYNIIRYSPQISKEDTDYYIRRAFEVWMEVTPLRFYQVNQRTVDVEIIFGAYSHGDAYPFDGLGNTLAHAFAPGEGLAGDVHFDDSEQWVIRTGKTGSDLFTVAVHEIGHALGLSHGYSEGSIMRPFYEYADSEYDILSHDDIAGIQYLYGPGEDKPRTVRPGPTSYTLPPSTAVPTQPPTHRPLPQFCKRQVHFDAILSTNTGKMYAFEGWQYVYIWNGNELDISSPKLTSDIFSGLHWGVDAAFSVKEGNKEIIYIFKLWFVWIYDAKTMRLIKAQVPLKKTFPDLPNNIDATFRWSQDGNIYAFKGSEYWKLIRLQRDLFKAAPDYPRSLADWNLPGGSVNAAMTWSTNGRTYFFNGRDYYKYDDRARKVEPGYPRNTNVWWLGCPDGPKGYNLGPELDSLEGVNGSVSMTTATWTLLGLALATILLNFS